MSRQHRFTVWQIYGHEWNERAGFGGDDIHNAELCVKLAQRLVLTAQKYPTGAKRIVAIEGNKVLWEWSKPRSRLF